MSRPNSLYINVVGGSHGSIIAAIDAAEEQLFNGIDVAMSRNLISMAQAPAPTPPPATEHAAALAPSSAYFTLAAEIDRRAATRRKEAATENILADVEVVDLSKSPAKLPPSKPSSSKPLSFNPPPSKSPPFKPTDLVGKSSSRTGVIAFQKKVTESPDVEFTKEFSGKPTELVDPSTSEFHPTSAAKPASKKHDWKPGVAPARSSLSKRVPSTANPVDGSSGNGSATSNVTSSVIARPTYQSQKKIPGKSTPLGSGSANSSTKSDSNPSACSPPLPGRLPAPLPDRLPTAPGRLPTAPGRLPTAPGRLPAPPGRLPTPISSAASPSASGTSAATDFVERRPAVAHCSTSRAKAGRGNVAPGGFPSATLSAVPSATQQPGALARSGLLAGRSSIPAGRSNVPSGPPSAFRELSTSVVNLVPGTHLVPGVGPIGRVAPNGFRQAPDGRLRPVVTLAQQPRVPLSARQKVADRLADASMRAGVPEMDAVVRAAVSEQKMYADAVDFIAYQSLSRSAIREVKNEGKR